MHSPLPPRFTLRPAGTDDALCLSVLAMQVWLDTYATEGIRPAIAREVLQSFRSAVFDGLLRSAVTRVHVAECKGHLIGFGQVTVGTELSLVESPNPAELDRLYVQEPFAHRGVGGALLAAAEADAASRGAAHLWLTPWVHNARALRFYAKHGYADVGAVDFVMEGERHENRVLVKRIDFTDVSRS